MTTLSTDNRRLLERTIVGARGLAERAARAALEALAVGRAKPDGHMSDKQKVLRNHLRARARQLGDKRAANDTHEIEHLLRECAYEHWHRMLFARFLAENNLLIEPEAGIAISLDECKELAKDEKTDLWTLAGRYAQRMLPQIFRADDPVLKVRLAREHELKLEGAVDGLPTEVFTATDSLGWCYQFWQTDEKRRVNESENKIGADELPAVTQLFTEDYMVDFLLDNTLGAWRVGRQLEENGRLLAGAKTEEECRRKVALPGCEWKYLRFVKDEKACWRPAAGTFDGWPKTAKDLKCMDPCCGSGHFLVAMFERLVALRMAEEGLNKCKAAEAAVQDNIFGLEIDPRCTQIAAFNLALAAWKFGGHAELSAPNIACSGLAPNTSEADWLATAGDNEKLRNGMERLYRLFQKAAVLGSLINPRAGEDDLLVAAFHELQPLLEKMFTQETNDDSTHEMAVTARGLAKAADILAGQFTLVATNVPFLGGSRQGAVLAEHLDRFYGEAMADLATAMIYRMREMASNACSLAFVSPQTWMFLRNYKRFRLNILRQSTLDCIAALGSRAFETITGEVVNVVLSVLTNTRPSKATHFFAIDANAVEDIQRKRSALASGDVLQIGQAEQVANPDHTIILSLGQDLPRLSEYATSWQGLVTGDTARFVIRFWEVPGASTIWDYFISSPSITADYCGRDSLVRWEKARGALHNDSGAHNFPPTSVLGKRGVLLSQGKTARATLFTGEIFNDGSVPIIPKREVDLKALYAFLNQEDFTAEVRKINQKLIMGCGYFIKVPFDLAHWQKVAAEKYPHGLPNPFSIDPTQWLFSGHPAGADQPLHVAVARLLGYQWPRQMGSSFPDCPALGLDGLEKLADDDGIVCIPSVRGEPGASDRLLRLLTAAGIKPDRDLDEWLCNSFFEEHCKLFHDRPFVWHIWDGRKRDGFHALVNYHKLADGVKGRRLLEKLTHAYLGDWITRQRAEVKDGKEGADARLAAALALKERLEAIIEGEPPYDIFVRWKPLAKQPIGWEPDINDGVRMNIRPFMASDLPGGKKGAGILRAKPKIKWTKDRGKEPHRPKAEYPWFWAWDEKTGDFMGGKAFDGNRWNDCHYSNDVKRKART